jgi:hypothetical protein
MIAWGWLIIAFLAGGWFGLLLAGILKASSWADEVMEKQGQVCKRQDQR